MIVIGGNAYVTSKAALEAHTLNLAAELAGSGVTVNVFRPGAVDITPGEPARSLVARLHTDATGQIWDVSDVLQ